MRIAVTARESAPTVRNTTDRVVHLEYGHLIGMLVRPGERTAVSAFEYG